MPTALRKTPPPPPPRPDEKRRHARFELFASVKVEAVEETLVLYARNLSLGGVLLDMGDLRPAQLPVGEHYDVLLFDAANEQAAPVRLRAQVARYERGAAALKFTSQDPDSMRKLTRLFIGLQPIPEAR